MSESILSDAEKIAASVEADALSNKFTEISGKMVDAKPGCDCCGNMLGVGDWVIFLVPSVGRGLRLGRVIGFTAKNVNVQWCGYAKQVSVTGPDNTSNVPPQMTLKIVDKNQFLKNFNL